MTRGRAVTITIGLSFCALLTYLVQSIERTPEHIVRELRENFKDNQDFERQVASFREHHPKYFQDIGIIQKAFDQFSSPQGWIYQLHSRKNIKSDKKRLEQWVILNQEQMSNEVAVASLQFARSPTAYGADAYDCFLPGIGVEWKDASGRSVRQIICLSCENLQTYIGTDSEPVSLPLSDEAMVLWGKVYRTYFPESE